MIAVASRYGRLATLLPRVLAAGKTKFLTKVKNIATGKAAKPSLFTRIVSGCVHSLRRWAKPLLAFPPIAALLAWHDARGQDEIDELDQKFNQNPEGLMKHHRDLQEQGLYQFYPAKSTGPKPLVVVNLGTMQEFNDKDAGLMKVVEHIRKHHDAHVLVLKAAHAVDAIKHCFGLEQDASSITRVRLHANSELIKDIVEAKGLFKDVGVDSVCPVAFSWGAGMISRMREQGLFEQLRIPVRATVTVDAIKPSLENLGEGLRELCAGDEANLHFYQSEPSYGLNGEHVQDCSSSKDQVYCVKGACHEELDNDPWVLAKICRFLDQQLRLPVNQP